MNTFFDRAATDSLGTPPLHSLLSSSKRMLRNRVKSCVTFKKIVVSAFTFVAFSAMTSLSHAQTISISPSTVSVGVGGTATINSSVSGATWTSADPRTVSVSSSGVVTGLATGTVQITATYQGKTATATVESSIGDVSWSGPITITQGGTYSGNWKSTSAYTPAVTVATSAAVIIQNSHVTGPGDLIANTVSGANITVKNVIGVGLNSEVYGRPNGLFMNAQNPANLDVENCYMENVEYGVWVRGYAGNHNGSQTIKILNNRVRNITGLQSNGQGGYLNGETDWSWGHAIQIGNVYGVPGMEIGWNELINYPNQSLSAESINMYEASGTSSSHVLVHDNYIQGAYPYNPLTDSYAGGGFVTDGNTGDTVATASAFNDVYNNQFISTTNQGAEIGAGHDNRIYNNRVVSSGLLPNGSKIMGNNVGIGIYDGYGNIQRGTVYNNSVYGNTVGWMCWKSGCSWDQYRNDEYFPKNNNEYSANTTMAAGPISYATENNEYQTWRSKISSDGVAVGPTSSSGAASSGSGSSSSGSSTDSSSTSFSTSAWYNIVNTNSSLCLDATEAGTYDGTAIIQYNCNSSGAYNQEWQFVSVGNGYYELANRNATNARGTNTVLDVTGGPSANGNSVPLQLWQSYATTNQEWMPVSLGNGYYKFVAHSSGNCVDVPGASSTVGLNLQQYDCNGTDAQSFKLVQR